MRSLVFAVWGLSLLACSSDELGSTPADADAGADVAQSGFGTTACYACSIAPCADQEQACKADPSCSTRLDCLKSCPASASGDVDASCDGACPPASGSVGSAAWQALTACRASAAATCSACGAGDASADGPNLDRVFDQDCPPSTLTAACDKCLEERCCESTALMTTPGPAKSVFDCWYDCGTDAACHLQCYEQYPEGVSGFAIWTACVLSGCHGSGDCVSSSACSQCRWENCGAEYAKCALNDECFKITACTGGCASSSCSQGCIDAHPLGALEFDDYAVCVTQNCASVCASP